MPKQRMSGERMPSLLAIDRKIIKHIFTQGLLSSHMPKDIVDYRAVVRDRTSNLAKMGKLKPKIKMKWR